MGHLKDVNSGYFKHLVIAMYFNTLLLIAVITGTIHAFFPFLFAFTPYNLAKRVVDKTEEYFINHK